MQLNHNPVNGVFVFASPGLVQLEYSEDFHRLMSNHKEQTFEQPATHCQLHLPVNLLKLSMVDNQTDQ
jgi:hypothetical protein